MAGRNMSYRNDFADRLRMRGLSSDLGQGRREHDAVIGVARLAAEAFERSGREFDFKASAFVGVCLEDAASMANTLAEVRDMQAFGEPGTDEWARAFEAASDEADAMLEKHGIVVDDASVDVVERCEFARDAAVAAAIEECAGLVREGGRDRCAQAVAAELEATVGDIMYGGGEHAVSRIEDAGAWREGLACLREVSSDRITGVVARERAAGAYERERDPETFGKLIAGDSDDLHRAVSGLMRSERRIEEAWSRPYVTFGVDDGNGHVLRLDGDSLANHKCAVDIEGFRCAVSDCWSLGAFAEEGRRSLDSMGWGRDLSRLGSEIAAIGEREMGAATTYAGLSAALEVPTRLARAAAVATSREELASVRELVDSYSARREAELSAEAGDDRDAPKFDGGRGGASMEDDLSLG